MVKRGTLTTVAAGEAVALAPGETGVLTLTVAADENFAGVAIYESSSDGGQNWTPLARYEGTSGSPLTLAVVEAARGKNSSEKFTLLRVRVDSIAEASDGISYCLTTASAVGVEPQHVTTNGTEIEECDLTVLETKVETSGSQGTEELVLGDGTGVRVGTRHLVTVEKLGHASDVLALDEGDIVNDAGAAVSAVTLGAVGDYILFEFNGRAWQIIWSSATGTTVITAV